MTDKERLDKVIQIVNSYKETEDVFEQLYLSTELIHSDMPWILEQVQKSIDLVKIYDEQVNLVIKLAKKIETYK
ncbi:hypothetical protein [Salipaludibacillus aurantiacus]|uniref:Uncharacterized protein n=1 Tax=Salipaludibacillus aurantiacus TaxID=1601833 RepID=A0A1H9UGB1_9BACI|nr:hypothetical protein [Salipaludibacillus aurantiacus]SES08301.1 hypothetical protein SAMN05518684_107189 [Salipaludibacillus aurantiacus]